MRAEFNAGEVFEIAGQIERNGARFYRRAAEVSEPGLARLFLDLAAMEEEHERTFALMAAELSAQERQAALYDPNDETAQYLRAVAGGYVFNLRSDPLSWLGQARTAPEILQKAIELEKDSIVFYVGIQQGMTERLGRDRVNGIIRQEMSHVSLLTHQLELATRK